MNHSRRGVSIPVISTIIAVVGVAFIIGLMYVTTSNHEVRLRNQITAVQVDNTSRFDNMWKKIKGAAEVTDEQQSALKSTLVEYAKARTGDGGGGSLAKWIHESVPNVDTSTFNNLQNIIIGSRDAWTNNQTMLIDLKREHDNVRTTFPGSLFVGSRPEIKIEVVTSSKTEAAFVSGKDDDTDVFKKK